MKYLSRIQIISAVFAAGLGIAQLLHEVLVLIVSTRNDVILQPLPKSAVQRCMLRRCFFSGPDKQALIGTEGYVFQHGISPIKMIHTAVVYTMRLLAASGVARFD
jgi:hypothetical protein